MEIIKIPNFTILFPKENLAKHGLYTTGNKAELQLRLRETIESKGIDLSQTKDVQREEAAASAKDL